MSDSKTGKGKASTVQPPSLTQVNRPMLQRQCACGAHTGGGECSECAKKKTVLQRKGASAAADGQPLRYAPPIVHTVLRDGGQPLDPVTRADMESKFNYDFSRVRVHTGGEAAASAKMVEARAYTVGSHIVFGSGEYQPASLEGRKLIGHELAHVIQQSGAGNASQQVPIAGPMAASLESEANRAAILATTAHPGQPASAPIATRIGEPTLSRAPSTEAEVPGLVWEKVTDPDLVALGIRQRSKATPALVKQEIRAYKVDNFPLPAEKGPAAFPAWDKRAKAGALRSFVDLTTSYARAGLKQQRDPTRELSSLWLSKVKWGSAAAAANWEAAGGLKSASGKFEPKVPTGTCEFDHVVELQIGGTNTVDNIAVLDREQNGKSGREIFNDALVSLAKKVTAIDSGITTVVLDFAAVTPPGDLCKQCCGVEKKAVEDAKKAPDVKVAGEYTLAAPTGTAVVKVPDDFGKSETKQAVDIEEKEPAAEIIPGLLVKKLHTVKKKEEADAALDRRSKKGVPVTLKQDIPNIKLNVDKKTGAVSLRNKSPNLAFTYPFLSDGTITHLEVDKNGELAGTAKLKPSIPLLSGLDLLLDFGPDRLEIRGGIPQDKLNVPIPGVHVKKADIGLQLHPEFKPRGTIEFAIGPKANPYVDGSVTLSTDDKGFFAKGDLIAHIPGVDEAKGTVEYHKDLGWSGTLTATTSKIPGVKSASVDATLTDKGLVVAGGVTLAIPKGPEIELKVAYKNGQVIYSGSTEIQIPGLKQAKPVKLGFVYDGKHLQATGQDRVHVPASRWRSDRLL